MLEFPGQHERSLELRRELASEFDLAERVFEFWMRATKDEWLAKSELSRLVKIGVAMALNTQACRLFRALVGLCAEADAYSADILARSLFETALASCFVLQETVPIRVRKKVKANGEISYFAESTSVDAVSDSEQPLSRDLRAMLYFAYQPLRTEKHSKALILADRFGDLGHSLAKRYDPALLEQLKVRIGPAWTSILPNAPTYAGLKIGELAKILGHELDFWYKSFYFLQSGNTHSADAAQHTNSAFGPEYLSDAVGVSNALFAGISTFMLCLLAANDNIDFGESTSTALAGFAQEYHAMR